MTRLKNFVTNPVERPATASVLPFYALEHIESGTGRLLSGVEISAVVDDTSVLHRRGDVRFGKLRPYLAKSLLMVDPGAGSGELLVLRPRRDAMDSKYLHYVTLSKPFVEWATATSYGVKMPRTNWDSLASFECDVPGLDEQRRIAAHLDAQVDKVDALVAEHVRQRRLLSDRFHGVLKERVTGRLGYEGPAHEVGLYWVGPVPATWRPEKIAWRFATGSGTTPPSGRAEFYEGGEVPWVNTAELRERVVDSTAKTVTAKALREFPTLRVYPAGSVVIALYGATIGRVGILGLDATVNQACCVLHCPTTVLPDFVFYWLWAHRGEIAALGAGGGQPNISQETIRAIRVPAPEVASQLDIVAVLRAERETFEALASELDRDVDLLNEHRQALITAAVTGGLEALQGVASCRST